MSGAATAGGGTGGQVGPAAPAPAEPAPLAGGALALAAIALALGTFMQVLDGSIANVSLPIIAGNLGVSADKGTWVITSFAVANGVTVPLTGWLMARFGVVRTFVGAVFLFTLASFLCGVAWNLSSLVAFRIFQGAVSGPMIPGSQALLMLIFPAHRRGTGLAIWSMTTLCAPVLGPVLGGFISDNFHWGWIFLINIPVGLGTGFVTWRMLGARETPTRKLPIDTVGLILLTFWVFSLQTMLDLGKDRDWFNSTLIIVLAACAAIGFVSWLIWELTERYPAVDLSLFRRRNFLFGVIAICLGYALLFGNSLLLPLWLQTNMGYTATWAGLVTAPSGLVAVIATPFVARLGKVDARWLATGAFLCYGISFLMRSDFTRDASFFVLVTPMLVQGVAMSIFFVPMLTIMLDGIPPERVPSASGISNFARITAGSFGASIITTLWNRREALHQARLVENVTAFSPPLRQYIGAAERNGVGPLGGAGSVYGEIIGQSYLIATTEIFWISGLLSLAIIGVIWIARRPGPARHAVAAD